MKKHPIDDLFKGKLSDVEKQPSANAWSRIQKQQTDTGQQFIGWIWYVAASVVIAVMTGYGVWYGQHKNSENFDSEKTLATIKNKSSQKLTTSVDSIKPDNSSIKEEIESTTAVVGKNEFTPEASKYNKPVLANKVVLKADLQNKIEVRNADIEEPVSKSFEVNPINPTKSIASSVQLEIEKEIAPKQALSSIEQKQESHTIVVNIDETESDSNEKNKSSRFTKVFRQLKNVRAGEPVDWKDVGFNPRTIVAKVDGRIRDKEEVISEKYQNIKGRTKL